MRARILLLLGLLLGPALLLGSGPAAAQNRFSLVNNTGETIERVFVSPSRLNGWGPDVLGQAVLQPGQSHWVVPQLSDCLLDVKALAGERLPAQPRRLGRRRGRGGGDGRRRSQLPLRQRRRRDGE